MGISIWRGDGLELHFVEIVEEFPADDFSPANKKADYYRFLPFTIITNRTGARNRKPVWKPALQRRGGSFSTGLARKISIYMAR
jgi:hypothetical protein